jgi:hypothetical protein
MVGSWPCKVSSEIHVNGRHVSGTIWKDKGMAIVSKSEDEKDSKRTCMVLSKGFKVIGPGYSRLLGGGAARVAYRGRELDNPNWVGQVLREYDTDQQIDWVTRGSQGNQTTARVSRQIGLLESARVTKIATRSRETPAGLTRLATRAENRRFQSGC